MTNGAVRDLAALEATRFQCFAGSVSVSHAYAHIVEMAEPVEIGSLKILSGDLLHADRHGVQTIPKENASELPRVVSEIASRERDLMRLCAQPDFSVEKLISALKRGSQDFPALCR